MKKIISLLGMLWVMLAMVQCTSQPAAEEEEHAHDEHAEGREEGIVMLSDVQIASAGVQTSSFDTMNVSGYVNANGNFDLPPENIAAITAPMQGTVKQANYLLGSYVKKGAVLAVLEHPDYIKMQEEYLNTMNNLGFLKAEYQRQKTLDSANITARKSFQQAEAAYLSAMTRKLSLEKQLAYVGIAPEQVAAGQMTTAISLRAPFSGHITQLNIHKGEFVGPEQELYELINTDHMHLELHVYEKDFASVKKGQAISFTVPSLGTESYKGEVFLVGQSFDMESKTVKIHGHISQMEPEFIRGLYVEASIFTGDEEVRALPEEAVVRDEGKTYIFIREEEAHSHAEETAGRHSAGQHSASVTGQQHEEREEYEHEDGTPFRRVEVVTGISRHGMVEIRSMENLPAGAAIVTTGAYDLFSEMKKGEGRHHH